MSQLEPIRAPYTNVRRRYEPLPAPPWWLSATGESSLGHGQSRLNVAMDRIGWSQGASDSCLSVPKRNDIVNLKRRSDLFSRILGRFGAACNLLYRW